jgi:hypothetical protein
MDQIIPDFDHFRVRLLNGRFLVRHDFDMRDFLHTRGEHDIAVFYTRAQLDWAMMQFMNSYECIGMNSPDFEVEVYDCLDGLVCVFDHITGKPRDRGPLSPKEA